MCLLFQRNILDLCLSGSKHGCSDSAGQRGHWQHHKKLSLSLPVYRNNRSDLKGQGKKKHFSSFAKMDSVVFSAITSLPLAHTHAAQEPSCTHANPSLAAEIWHNHAIQIPIREDMWDWSFISSSSSSWLHPFKSVWLQQISAESTARVYYIQPLVRQMCFHLNYTPLLSLPLLLFLPCLPIWSFKCVIKYYNQIAHRLVLYRLQ